MVKGKRTKKVNTLFGYKKLALYKKAKNLVLVVYKTTSSFPNTETYTLVSQMRRPAISVLANIVEGYSKETSAEYARFLTISIGSVAELEVYLNISFELGFIDKKTLDKINKLIAEVKTLLYGSRKAVRVRAKK